MNKEHFPETSPETWEMLARFMAGESSSEEAARVREWLAAEPARAQLVAELEGTFSQLPHTAAADVDVEAALSRVRARRIEERTPVAWRSNWVRIAAAILIVLGASAIWKTAGQRRGFENASVAAMQVYRTLPGQTDSISLTDGSKIILGPGSQLNVAAGYGKTSRAVTLTGEALFDVVHNDAQPMSVTAGAATIRDVGTTFTVRSNPGEAVHVAVTEGSVVLRATSRQESEGVVLKAGDHGVLQRDGRVSAQTRSVSDDDLAWTRGRLVFDDATLDHVAAELRRWYGIELRADDGDLTKRHVTASFKGESADQVLKVIGLALGARIERNGDTAFVHAH